MNSGSPLLERRRALRRQKRQEKLSHAWQTLLLLLLSGSMAWLLLRFGWTLEGSHQVLVRGNTELAPERVASSGGFSFPADLLKINPAQLERELARELPVEFVQVRRLVFPARLEVRMQTRTPAARATRRIPGGIDLGLVDADGQWIQPNAAIALPAPTTEVSVEGWSARQSLVIATLLREQTRFDNSLQRIVLKPDGAVQLHCARLGRIDLGRNTALLDQQITAVEQLLIQLPDQLMTKPPALIDLSNPERPEIELKPDPTS